MNLGCKYHQEQGEALGRSLGLGRYTKEEASAERRELAKEIAGCEKCMMTLTKSPGMGGGD